MAGVPLFTKRDLETAFALVVPGETAKATAERCGGSGSLTKSMIVDTFLYEDPRERSGVPQDAPAVVAAPSVVITEAELFALERDLWASQSLEDRIALLMSFSSFHFGLLGLLSDELRERMRVACGMSPVQAEQVRTHVRRAVAAIRAGGSSA